MLREFLKSKIHRATITESNLDYVGSLTLDEELMEKAGIAPNERVHVYNISTGARFETYAITGRRGGRQVGLNGAAARLGSVGDLIIIATYIYLTEAEIPHHRPQIVVLGPGNEIEKVISE
ncbi:MAG: aspartate 1-decarboxylase [Calditrichia bacterium]